jgi:hypothetical protein
VRLRELEPVWIRYWTREVDQTSFADTSAHPGKRTLEGMSHAWDITEAQGIRFTCPKCSEHQVIVWFRDRGVPDSATPGPGRWVCSGISFDDLSLTPSINLSGGGCGWHGFITNGEIV